MGQHPCLHLSVEGWFAYPVLLGRQRGCGSTHLSVRMIDIISISISWCTVWIISHFPKKEMERSRVGSASPSPLPHPSYSNKALWLKRQYCILYCTWQSVLEKRERVTVHNTITLKTCMFPSVYLEIPPILSVCNGYLILVFQPEKPQDVYVWVLILCANLYNWCVNMETYKC